MTHGADGNSRQPVRPGFVGLGVMGEYMASNLLTRSGLPLNVFDLSRSQVEKLIAQGATPQQSVKCLSDASDIVFLSLPSIEQVEDVCEQILTATNAPRFVCDMSTSDVTRTRSLAHRMSDFGIEFIDAPVARTRQAAIDGTLLVSVGARESSFQDVKPLLACMGSTVLHCGPVGSGQIVKILNNMVVFMTVHALAEAAAISDASGLDSGHLFEILTNGSADSFALRHQGLLSLAKQDFPVNAFPTLYAIKDLALALDLAKSCGVTAVGAELTMGLLEQTRELGFEHEYYPILAKAVPGYNAKAK